MKIKSKWATALGVRRAAVLAGTAGLALGAALLTAGSSAMAANGSEPGNLTLSPPSGPLSTNPTWSTTDACPAGFQGSASVFEYNTDGTQASLISPVEAPANAPFTNMAFIPGFNVGLALSVTNIQPGQSIEWAVTCYSGGNQTGNSEIVQSTMVTESADGTSYSSGEQAVGVPTNTTLTANPSPATATQPTTLTATVTAQDGSHPAGSVVFSTGGSNIGTGNTDANGVVSVPFTPSSPAPSPGLPIQAVFTPSDPTAFGGSTGNLNLIVNPFGTQTAGAETITVTVPQTGQLTVTLAPGTVTLAVAGTTPPLQGLGTLQNVTVMDTRNFAPGWSVMGQLGGDFLGSGTAANSSIPADDLGWAPTAVQPLQGGAVLGPVVPPGTSPGLGDTGEVLASAAAGNGIGTNVLSADLTLNIPTSAVAGDY
ncbi:MAG: hypothetical protein J2P27_05955, partial [Actinobacteria bacterium]|nr:hypothetical protein [Actinomycetota bacterium]